MTLPDHLNRLPPEVLYKVLSEDQTSRVACMLASRGLYRALHTPSVWTSIHFDQLEPRALEFLRFAKECRSLSLAAETADEALWFLEAAAETCPALGTSLARLQLRVVGGGPVPGGLPAALTAFGQLESVAVELAGAEPSEARFSDIPSETRLPSLTSFSWVEAADDVGSRACRLSGMSRLTAAAPALADVHVEARSCDLLDSEARPAALRRVTYLGSGEQYEHARLADLNLDELRLHVHPESDRWRLAAELALARRIGKLHLTVDDHFVLLSRVNVEELTIETDALDVCVSLDYDLVARWIPRLRVAVEDPYDTPLNVRFLGVDFRRLADFAAWADSALDVDWNVTIVLEPGFAA
jgi:hypothetical protein